MQSCKDAQIKSTRARQIVTSADSESDVTGEVETWLKTREN
jgi:hypothetical protein